MTCGEVRTLGDLEVWARERGTYSGPPLDYWKPEDRPKIDGLLFLLKMARAGLSVPVPVVGPAELGRLAAREKLPEVTPW